MKHKLQTIIILAVLLVLPTLIGVLSAWADQGEQR